MIISLLLQNHKMIESSVLSIKRDGVVQSETFVRIFIHNGVAIFLHAKISP